MQQSIPAYSRNSALQVILATILIILFSSILQLITVAAKEIDSAFSLDLNINGSDLFAEETLVIDPEETMAMDLYIYNVLATAELDSLSIELFFTGIPLTSFTEELNLVINPGQTYRPIIQPVNLQDYLSIRGVNITTGKYQAFVKINYSISGQPKTWTQPKDIEILGNPITTVAGGLAVVVTGFAIAAIISLVKSAIGYNIQTKTLSAKQLLESRTRGATAKAIVSATKNLVVKDKCPICSDKIKHGFCYTCQKSTKEIQKLYQKNVQGLAVEGSRLLSNSDVTNLDEMCSRLGITGGLANDVKATIQNAKLFQARRISGRLVASAVLMGISSGISTVLWLTIGGFALLGTSTLLIILILFTLIPFIVTKILQSRIRRKLRLEG